jgi:hypothetical protein
MKYITVDETKYWNQSILDKIGDGRIKAVYLFNPEEKTYCCEITPSYYLTFAGYYVTKEVDEETFELIQTTSGEDHYRYCHSIVGEKEIAGDTIEEALEEYGANCGQYQE